MNKNKDAGENKDAATINKLLNRIPAELLENKDLTFRVQKGEENATYILISFSNLPEELDEMASIGIVHGKDCYYFSPDEGTCPVNDITPKLYCKQAAYLKSVKFDGRKICPHTSLCDKIKRFIRTYESAFG